MSTQLDNISKEVIAAISDVRDDKSSTDWALASFTNIDSWE